MPDEDSQREKRERLRERYLALRSVLHDRVTGLPVIPLLFGRVRSWLRERGRIGVLHLEIDNLELVESLYGWQVFDRVLERVAEVLGSSRGKELPREALLAVNAVGGDRFVVFVKGRPDGGAVDDAYLAVLAERSAWRLSEAFRGEEFTGLNPDLEFRWGHALLSHNPFYRFERRVYAAVEEARAYDQRRNERRNEAWSDELQELIEEQAVATLFQPVVDLRTHEVLGYEALTRGPRNSPLEMPRTLFALSSRIGRAADLDHICRESALRESARMIGRGKLFLNVLPLSVEHRDWGQEKLHAELQAASLEPSDLVLEFSERGWTSDTDLDALVCILHRLKQEGFGIALDDIGTGYGTQAILERVRPDYLKLDVSFVNDVATNLIKQELLRSLIRIAERIGAAVIAEGVETEAEAKVLMASGARYGQGYLFASPAPAGRCEPRFGTKSGEREP